MSVQDKRVSYHRHSQSLTACPSDQAVNLINSVAKFLGEGAQHHGAMIASFLESLGLSETHESVRIDLMPAQLDIIGVSKNVFVNQAASSFGDFWFPASQWKDQSLIKQLIQKRLQAMLTESEAPGQSNVSMIGYDRVEVTIDLEGQRFEHNG